MDPAGRPPSGAAVGCATVGITDGSAPATLLMGTMSPSDVVDPAGRPPSGAAVDSTAVGTTDDSAPATLLMGTISPSDVVDSAGRPPSSVVSAAVGMTTFGNIEELGATLLPNAFVKVVYSAGSVGIGRSESWAGLNTTPAFVVPDGPLLDATALLSPLLSPPLRSVAVAGRPVSDTGRETSVVFTPDKPTPNEAPIDGGVLSLPVSVSAEEAAVEEAAVEEAAVEEAAVEEAAVEEAAEESPLPGNVKEGRTSPASVVGTTVGCAIGD